MKKKLTTRFIAGLSLCLAFLAFIYIFNKPIYNTWWASSKPPADINYNQAFHDQIECGDLLALYAEMPEKLEALAFVKCEKTNGQTVARATYRVSGKASQAVEGFFVRHYGMGKLHWVCCGWENSGGNGGSFNHKALAKISPNLSGIISMHASGEVPPDNELEFDRNKIPYFTVEVELIDV